MPAAQNEAARGSSGCRGRNDSDACSVPVGLGRLAEARVVLPEDAELADGVAAERGIRLLADVVLLSLIHILWYQMRLTF